MFEDNKRNCKAVWNRINEIIYSKSKIKAWELNFLLINGRAVSQPKDIAEHLNVFYINKQRTPKTHTINKEEFFW